MKNGFCLKVSVDLRCGYYSYRILPPPPFPCGLRHQLSYTRNLKIVNGNDVSCRQMDVWLDACMSNWMDGWLVGWLAGWEWRTFHWIFICLQQFVYGLLVHVFPTAVPINILDGVNIVRPVLQQRRDGFVVCSFALKTIGQLARRQSVPMLGRVGVWRTVGQVWLLMIVLLQYIVAVAGCKK